MNETRMPEDRRGSSGDELLSPELPACSTAMYVDVVVVYLGRGDSGRRGAGWRRWRGPPVASSVRLVANECTRVAFLFKSTRARRAGTSLVAARRIERPS